MPDWRKAILLLSSSDDGETVKENVEIVVREFRRSVYATAMRFAQGDKNLAADIFQQTFVKLIEGRRKIRSPVAFPRFLKVVATNVARDILRRQGRELQAPDLVFYDEKQVFENRLFETRLYLQAYLELLDSRQRDVLVAKFFAGEDDVTTAKKLGETPGNIRVIRHRALTRLRALIREDDDSTWAISVTD